MYITNMIPNQLVEQNEVKVELYSIEKQKDYLASKLNSIAQTTGLHSVLIMQSTATHMVVFTANEQRFYSAGDAGGKSTQTGCKELYCERVVDTQSELLVANASADIEWKDNEDLVQFGLGVYYGVPIMYDQNVIGTVCALNQIEFDFEKYDPSAKQQIIDLKLEVESLLKKEASKSVSI